MYPRTDPFTAISERFGVNTNALMTFPGMYGHRPRKSIAIYNSKMATSKPEIRILYDSIHQPVYLCFGAS